MSPCMVPHCEAKGLFPRGVPTQDVPPQRGAGELGRGGASSEQGVCVRTGGSWAGPGAAGGAGKVPGQPRPRSWAGRAASHIPGVAGPTGACVGAGQVQSHCSLHPLPTPPVPRPQASSAPRCPQTCPNIPRPAPSKATPAELCCQLCIAPPMPECSVLGAARHPGIQVPARPALACCRLPRVPALWWVQPMPGADAAWEPGVPGAWDGAGTGRMRGWRGQEYGREPTQSPPSLPRPRGCVSAHRNKVSSTKAAVGERARDTLGEDGKRQPGPCSACHFPRASCSPGSDRLCATTKHRSLGRAHSGEGAPPGDVLLPCHPGWLSLRSSPWRRQPPWSRFQSRCREN